MMSLACRRSQRFRQPKEEAAPWSKLRRADADAGAIADLVLLVEEVDDIETCGQRARTRNGKQVRDAGIDLRVRGQMIAVRYAGAAVGGGYTGRQRETRAQSRADQEVRAESR